MTRFLVVPQWQGSSSSRAMQLVDGAAAIAGDLPRARTTSVAVPLEAGESLDSGVRRLSALQQTARAQLQALTEADDVTLTVGGDAGVATTSALFAAGTTPQTRDAATVVVWLGAHAAMHDPASSPTGAFETMAARAVVDRAAPFPALDALAPGRLVLAGTREIDLAEAEAIDRLGVTVIPADALTPESLAAAVAAREPSGVFVHIALDVLDPAAVTGLTAPEPFGPDVAAIAACVQAVRAIAPLVGAALTGFSPASPEAALDDLGAILRLIGALA